MVNLKKKCLISGTSGYVGSHLRNYFLDRNWEVYDLKHHIKDSSTGKATKSSEHLIYYSLGDTLDNSVFENIEVLIHCAYDFCQYSWDDIYKINVEGSIRLLKLAKAASVNKVIFISSIAAFNGCESLYGKAKLEIEKEASKLSAYIIRPGLIYSKSPGGMFGTLDKLISLTSVVPLIGDGSNIVYPVHIDDICKLIFLISSGDNMSNLSPILAAHKDGKTFRKVLETLAASKNKKLTFIKLPYSFVLGILKSIESIGIRTRMKSDSLVSMMNYDRNPEFDPSILQMVQFREFNLQTLCS